MGVHRVSKGSVAHRVVIVGGGFGGLHAARMLRRAPVEVVLVDRRNFHLFQPLLYQVATGALSPANIAAPLRSVLKRQRNVRVVLAAVTGIDAARARLFLRDPITGDELSPLTYDTLVVAAGSRPSYFNHEEWSRIAPGLKTVEDATEIRSRILAAFEAAERDPDDARTPARLTFVVVGGGPTGVELAGAIAEIARDTLRHDFRRFDPRCARILLVEAGPRILPTYPADLAEKALHDLERLGVAVRTSTRVIRIESGRVEVRSAPTANAGPDPAMPTVSPGAKKGSAMPAGRPFAGGPAESRSQGALEEIPCETVLWAAGVRGSELGEMIAAATGAQLDRMGRVIVRPDLTLPGRPEIFVIGDLAHYAHPQGMPARWIAEAEGAAPKPLPGVAQVAIQQGRFVAKLIRARLEGRPAPRFRYRDLGDMATIGRASAVADFRWLRLSGYIAWLAWLFVHLMNLVQFGNRVLVFTQWAGNYFTRNRSARLITGEPGGRIKAEPP